MSAVLDKFQEAQNQVLERIAELEPLVREYEELTQIVARLDAAQAPVAAGSPQLETRPRRRADGRARSEGGRRDDIQRIVAETPGVTINQLGKVLEVDPTGLYRPVRSLVNDGLIHKQGPNLYPQTSASLHLGSYLKTDAA